MSTSKRKHIDRIINENVRLLRNLMKELAKIEEEKKPAYSRVHK